MRSNRTVPRAGLPTLAGTPAPVVAAGVVALVVAGAALVHATGGTRTAWLHVLYVPVLLAALRFGVRGAVPAALLGGLAVGPAMPLDVAAGLPQDAHSWVLRTLLLVVVAVVAGTGQDLARARHRALSASESRFRALVHHASDLILVVGEAGEVRYASPSVRRLLGLVPEEVLGRPLASLLHPVDAPKALVPVPRDGPQVEARMRHADGSWRHLALVTTDLREDPSVGGLVVNGHDITERRAVEAELQYRATHDSLTGLANRSLLRRRLAEALDGSPGRPASDRAAVLLLNIEHLEGVNEAYGPAAAERVVAALAARLQDHLAIHDLLALYSGSELAVLSTGLEGHGGARALAGHLLEVAHEPFTLGDHEVFLTVSVGVAMQRPEHDVETLIADAYVALQEAKQAYGQRIVVFAPHLRARRSIWIRTDGALHRALRNSELRLHLQPIVQAPSGRLVGVEALVRWQHPNLGLIPPMEFIPVAEQTDLIRPIGAWVLERACSWLAAWRRRDPGARELRLSVNASAQQLADPDLPEAIEDALHGTDVPADRLTLEITETTLIGDARHTKHMLEQLRAIGVRIAVDDFGTGYSSLGLLNEMPVDILKIDRSFVRRLGADQDDAILSAVVGLARSLDLRTVAEGVETRAQSRSLLALGCELQQGFLFGRPLPPERLDVAALLTGDSLPGQA